MLDYGGQYSQLIARRVRDCGVFSELLPHHVPLEEIAARKPRGIILSGGPASVYADGAPPLERGLLELGVPVMGICYGMQLLVHALGGRVEQAEVGEFGRSELHVSDAGRAAEGDAARADLLDVAPRHRVRAAAGLHRAGLLERLAGGGGRGSERRHLRHPVPPRGRAHPLRPGDPDALPDRGVRLRADVVGGVDRRGTGPAHPRAGGRGQRDLRALRRRGLLGGGAAGAPRGRRAADVRVRRPRPDAQGRGRAGGEHVPRHVQGAAGGGRRGDALPGEARGRDRARGQAQGDRRGVHQGLRGGGRASWPTPAEGAGRQRASSCRARSTRT